MVRALFALLAVAVCPSASAAQPDQVAAVENGLRGPVIVAGEPVVMNSIAERMSHYDVPGVSIAIVEDGAIAWAKGYGSARHEQPVTTRTLFQAGSISKPVTAVAAMKLVAAGQLPLDSDVNEILQSWKVPRSQRVTLRQLLSHTAGIGVHAFYPGYEPGSALPTSIQILNGQPPATNPPITVEGPPGQTFDYSGGGYQVVQQILSDVSGMPFEKFMADSLLKPLAMEASGFVQVSPETASEHHAFGHDRDGVELPSKWFLHPEMAAAGLWSTPTDLARLGIALSDAWNGKNETVLSRDMARAMLSAQVGGWGLGFQLQGKDKAFRFRHGGDNPGFKSVMVVFPTRGQGAVVMTNGDRGDRLADEILFSVAAAFGWSDYAPKTKVRAAVPAAELARVAGTYVLNDVPDVRLVIVPKSVALSLTLIQPSGESTVELLPAGNGHFFRRDIDFELHFADGVPAQRATLVQDGSTFTATRAATQP